MADEGLAPIVEQSAEEPAPAEEAPPPPPPPPETQVEESDGAQMKVQEKKNCGQSFKEFLYDGKTGRVLGRGGLSWLKILIFYIIFYIAIFAFFFMLLFIVFQFTDKEKPRLTGGSSLLKGNPGLGFRPTNPYKDVNPNSALIWYNRNDKTEWKKYVDQLKNIVGRHSDNKGIKYKSCDINTNTKKFTKKESCLAYDTSLDWGECNSGADFGYPKGRPCVLIRLNRIIGWKPEINTNFKDSEAYKKMKEKGVNMDELPKTQLDEMKDISKYIWIQCFGEKTVDKDLIGHISFYPHSREKSKQKRPPMTIPNTFFPYMSQPGYLDPFIMVQFRNPTPGVLIKIRCQAYNEKIMIDAKDGLGSVSFELLVDSTK